MRLLMVEDEPNFGAALRAHLEGSGCDVDWVRSIVAAETALTCSDYNCLVLDLNLPDGSGADLVRRTRMDLPRLPSVVVSGRRQVEDRIGLLDLGADDFLVKPIDLDEATARIRAVVRRSSGGVGIEEQIQVGELRVYPGRRQVIWQNQQVKLTNREYWLLDVLLRYRGQFLTRARLEELIYGWDELLGSNAIEVHVHNLRRKLSRDLILSVRNLGYCLSAEAHA